MQRSEEIFTEIMVIRDSQKCTLGEAVIAYAEAADSDVEDVIKALDAGAVLQIKESLKTSVALKPSMRAKPAPVVLFE